MFAGSLVTAAMVRVETQRDDALALGDEEFRALHAATARPLWAYLAAAGGDPALADDLLQESYLRLLRAARLPADADGRRRYLYRLCDDAGRMDPLRRHDTVLVRGPLDVSS